MIPQSGFVERTRRDAIGAIRSVLDPELDALFWIDVPFVHPGIVRDCFSLQSGFTEGDCLGRAGFCAAFTVFAEIPCSEGSCGIRFKVEFCEDLD
jgi:hypothetical protein